MVAGFDQLLEQLRAAGEATRLRTLMLLARGELSVTELTQILDQSQPRVSRHLKVLTEAGLVERHQEGAWVFYRLAPSAALDLDGIKAVDLPQADAAALATVRQVQAEDAARYFAEHATEWEALRTRHIAEEEIEAALLRLAGDGGDRFVDLGTGTGRMLVLFKSLYSHGIGYDLSAEMLSIARAQLADAGITHAQVRRGDFLEDPLPEDADLVCLHHVLHFLAEPERLIGLVADALSLDGQILIADFAPHTHEDLREDHAHRRLGFRDEEIEGWARRAGLMITANERFDPPMADGLVTCIWRLERQSRIRPSAKKLQENHVPA
ncbi:metalloregulator ArsR/SmtB family transcription factor [Parvularcula sp. LCG005]|uniref:ArsR/SmtB family transcription factor n=1 Tax=Parvularcula sp. LCG005 TaxID=3078805 RepID=UPI002943075B|nr:metalloregulator ArsR/SmtB family transcription factor [Parvularcula sp. LCG005]WOI53842.1 metalloregulator ArsR/SmtB family transcription factor [Parvularcula sp. LCG005]